MLNCRGGHFTIFGEKKSPSYHFKMTPHFMYFYLNYPLLIQPPTIKHNRVLESPKTCSIEMSYVVKGISLSFRNLYRFLKWTVYLRLLYLPFGRKSSNIPYNSAIFIQLDKISLYNIKNDSTLTKMRTFGTHRHINAR